MEDSYQVPKWVTKFVASVLFLVIPLESWQTFTLMRLEQRLSEFDRMATLVQTVREEQLRRTSNVYVVKSLKDSVESLTSEVISLRERVARLEKP